MQRHPRAGDARRTGAAVRLNDVAVDRDRVLAERLHVHHGTQAAADQALDLHGAALAIGRLATRAAIGGGGQHGVLRRDPALSARLAPARHALLDGGGTEHLGVAELDKAGTQCVLHHVAREVDGAHRICGAVERPVDEHVIHGVKVLSTWNGNVTCKRVI